MNLPTLYTQLGIPADAPSLTRLTRLQSWFCENISRDVAFTGDTNNQLSDYEQTITAYFDQMPVDGVVHDVVNTRGENESWLSYLAKLGYDKAIAQLKSTPAELNSQNTTNGMTALHWAAVNGRLYTVQTLLERGASADIMNHHQQPPLFSALFLPLLHDKVLREHKIGIFDILKAHTHEPLSHQDDSGETILHKMAQQGFDTLMEVLLTSDPKLAYIADNYRQYPIFCAILQNHLTCTTLLLNIPNSDTLADSNGQVALHYAALYANPAVLTRCCELCRNINPLDNRQKTPLMLAEKNHRREAIDILKARGATQ